MQPPHNDGSESSNGPPLTGIHPRMMTRGSLMQTSGNSNLNVPSTNLAIGRRLSVSELTKNFEAKPDPSVPPRPKVREEHREGKRINSPPSNEHVNNGLNPLLHSHYDIIIRLTEKTQKGSVNLHAATIGKIEEAKQLVKERTEKIQEIQNARQGQFQRKADKQRQQKSSTGMSWLYGMMYRSWEHNNMHASTLGHEHVESRASSMSVYTNNSNSSMSNLNNPRPSTDANMRRSGLGNSTTVGVANGVHTYPSFSPQNMTWMERRQLHMIEEGLPFYDFRRNQVFISKERAHQCFDMLENNNNGMNYGQNGGKNDMLSLQKAPSDLTRPLTLVFSSSKAHSEELVPYATIGTNVNLTEHRHYQKGLYVSIANDDGVQMFENKTEMRKPFLVLPQMNDVQHENNEIIQYSIPTKDGDIPLSLYSGNYLQGIGAGQQCCSSGGKDQQNVMRDHLASSMRLYFLQLLFGNSLNQGSTTNSTDHMEPVMQLHQCGCPCCNATCECSNTLENAVIDDLVDRMVNVLDHFVGDIGMETVEVQLFMDLRKNLKSEENNKWCDLAIHIKPVVDEEQDAELMQSLFLVYTLPQEACRSPSVAYLDRFLQSNINSNAPGRERRTPNAGPPPPSMLPVKTPTQRALSPMHNSVENTHLDLVSYHALHYSFERNKTYPKKPIKPITAMIIPERWRHRTALWTDLHSAVVQVKSIGSDTLPLSARYICFCGNYNQDMGNSHHTNVTLCSACNKVVPIFLHKYTLKTMYSRVRSIAPISNSNGCTKKHNTRDCPYCVPTSLVEMNNRKKSIYHLFGNNYALDIILAKSQWTQVLSKYLKSQLCSESIEFHQLIALYYKQCQIYLTLHWKKIVCVDILANSKEVPEIPRPCKILPTPQQYEFHNNTIYGDLYSKCLLKNYIEYLSKTGGHTYCKADGNVSLSHIRNIHTDAMCRIVAMQHSLTLQDDLIFLGERNGYHVLDTNVYKSQTLEDILGPKENANVFQAYINHEYKLMISNDQELDVIASNTTAYELQECLQNIILYALKTYIEEGAPKQVNIDNSSRNTMEIAAQHVLTSYQRLQKTGMCAPFSPLQFSAGHKVVHHMIERDVFKRFPKSPFYSQLLQSSSTTFQPQQAHRDVSGWHAGNKANVQDALGFGYLHINVNSIFNTVDKRKEKDVFVTLSCNNIQIATPVVDQSGFWESENDAFLRSFTSKKKGRPLIILREGHIQIPHSCPIFHINQSCPGLVVQLRKWHGESKLSINMESTLLASLYIPFDALILPMSTSLQLPMNNNTTSTHGNVDCSQYGEFFHSEVQDRVFFNYSIVPTYLTKVGPSSTHSNAFDSSFFDELDTSISNEGNDGVKYKYVIDMSIDIKASCSEAARLVTSNTAPPLKYITHNLLVAPVVSTVKGDGEYNASHAQQKAYITQVHEHRFKIMHIAGESNLFWWNQPQTDAKKQTKQSLVEYKLRTAGQLYNNPPETSQLDRSSNSTPTNDTNTPAMVETGAKQWPFLENERYEDIYCQRDQCPPLLSLLLTCKNMKAWLDKHPQNVLLLQSHNGVARPGLFICCYLLYSGQCKTSSDAITVYTKQYDSNNIAHPTNNGNLHQLNGGNTGGTSNENMMSLFTPSQINYIYGFELFLMKHELTNTQNPMAFPNQGTPMSPSISLTSSRHDANVDISVSHNNHSSTNSTNSTNPIHTNNSLCLYTFNSPLYSLQSIQLGPIPAAKRFKVRNVIQRLKGTSNTNHGKIQALYNVYVLSHDFQHQDNTPTPHMDYLDDGKNMFIKVTWDAGIPIQGDVKIEIWDQLMATLQSLPVCSFWQNTNTLENVNSHVNVNLQRSTPLNIQINDIHNANHTVQNPILACSVHNQNNAISLSFNKDELDYACNDTIDRVTPNTFNVTVDLLPINSYNNKFDRQVSILELNQKCMKTNIASSLSSSTLDMSNHSNNSQTSLNRIPTEIPSIDCEKCNNCGYCFACLLKKSTFTQTKEITYHHNVSTQSRQKLDLQVGMAARLSKVEFQEDDDSVIMQTVQAMLPNYEFDDVNDSFADSNATDSFRPLDLMHRPSLFDSDSPTLEPLSPYTQQRSFSFGLPLDTDAHATIIKRAPNLPLPPPPPPM